MSNGLHEKALIALLCELEKKGIDVDAVVQQAKAGIMAGENYAPAGAAKKPQVVDALEKAYDSAKQYIAG